MGLFNALTIPIHIFNYNFHIHSNLVLGMVSILCIAFLLLFYVIVFEIPQKAEQLLLETYPEYKMS